MLGKLLLGGVVLCVGAGAYLGWRFARSVPELPFESPPLAPEHAAGAVSSAPVVLERPHPERAALVSATVVGSDASPAAGAPPDARNIPTSIAELVLGLRDDGVRGNAMRAVRELLQAGEEAVPALVVALDAEDEQQRALAASVLAYRGGHGAPPALARELLALLTPPPGERFHSITARPWIHGVGRANLDERVAAFRAFERDAELFARVEDDLETRLHGTDPVLRFDAARLVLAHATARGRVAALRALVLHLEDNRLDDDAALAMRLLADAGAEGLRVVRESLPGADAQAARLLAHFLAHHDPSHAAARKLAPRALSAMGFANGDMLAAR